MTRSEAIVLILHELALAEMKHRGFPKDPVHGVAIMAEEAGEAVQAALNLYYTQKEDQGELLAFKNNLKKELAQTGAMCVRNLINMED